MISGTIVFDMIFSARATLVFQLTVRTHDLTHQRVADNVGILEFQEPNVINMAKRFARITKA
jgi:hypothetical protein